MTLPSLSHKRADERRSRKAYYEMESIIEVILAHPEKSKKEQAALANVSTHKFNVLTNSDIFESLRQERIAQLVDPILSASLEKSLLITSLTASKIVNDKLQVEPTLNEALQTLKVTTQALGMQNRQDNKPVVQNNIQIAWLPPQS